MKLSSILFLVLFFSIKNCCAKIPETLSLSATAVDVRTVLQQIADLAERNIVVAEEVQGDISLHVRDVDWQTALESVLEAKQLQAVDKGGVTLITSRANELTLPPLPTIATTENNSPSTRIIPLRYSNAEAILTQFQIHKQNYLSSTGSISADLRTNSVILRDEIARITAACELITTLDIPVQQVMIAARIVNIQNNLSRELGVRWGLVTQDTNQQAHKEWIINLPAAPLYGAQTSFTIAKLPRELAIDLELAALESEHLIEEIANPRLITINQQQALIRQGDEIPYQETSANGATSVSFRDAVLELRVTPTITYGNNILLLLAVKNDSRSAESLAGNIPVISTKEMSTQVILADGETLMLGGIYSHDKSTKYQRVPFLGAIPLIGYFFRNDLRYVSHKEMLIFVTPQILSDSMLHQDKHNFYDNRCK